MKGRILIIDDETILRETFKEFLVQDGYDVVTADGYRSALDEISKQHPDVILADILLEKGFTGIDILKEIKTQGLLCPVIMVTGQPDIDTAAESVRLGAHDYLSKPVKKQVLIRTAEQAMRHKVLLDEKQHLESDNEQYRLHLDAIFRSVEDGIITVKSDLTITSANKAIEHFIGTDHLKIVGRPFPEIIDENQAACISVVQNTLEMKMPVHDFNVEWKGAQNRSQSVVLNSSPLMDRDNTFLGVVLVMRDTTKISHLEKSLKERYAYHHIIGKSSKMQDIYSLLDILAETDSTVLIEGDSGTGKELIADALHYNSPRSQNQIVKVNCSALSDNLLESELFGHVKGSFTGALSDKTGRFQMADGGTIFLDEIGDISPAIQLKILRFIQEKKFERVGDSRSIEVNVRIVSATNRNLKNEVALGRFREDLYYRLKVVKMEIPPLCQRRDDIPLLVNHFLEILNRKFNKHIYGMSDDVRTLFMKYSWPGNVRELEHALEHAFVLCQGGTIMCEHLPSELEEAMSGCTGSSEEESAITSNKILNALQKTKGNKTEAAGILGISRRTIYRKIKEYNLTDHM